MRLRERISEFPESPLSAEAEKNAGSLLTLRMVKKEKVYAAKREDDLGGAEVSHVSLRERIS